MIAARIAQRHYRSGLDELEQGNINALLASFHPECRLSFAGDSALGADQLHGPQLTSWFQRFVRLFPNPRFVVRTCTITGPPWRQQLAATVTIEATVADRAYHNLFAHFLTIRWGRVIEDRIIEDTARLERALAQLADSGVAEAAAPAIR